MEQREAAPAFAALCGCRDNQSVDVQLKKTAKLAIHGEPHDGKVHEADAVVLPVRAAEPRVPRPVRPGDGEVLEPIRAPDQTRLVKRWPEQDARAASRPDHRREPAFLDGRLRDRDDGVAARARAHRDDALDQAVEGREAVVRVLLARPLWEDGPKGHVLIDEEERDMEARVPPVNGIPRLGRKLVEDALTLRDGLGERAQRGEDATSVSVFVKRCHVREAGKLRPLGVNDEHPRPVAVGPGEQCLKNEGYDARRLPASGLPRYEHRARRAQVDARAVLHTKLVRARRLKLGDGVRHYLAMDGDILDMERHPVARLVRLGQNDGIALEAAAEAAADAGRKLGDLLHRRRGGGDGKLEPAFARLFASHMRKDLSLTQVQRVAVPRIENSGTNADLEPLRLRKAEKPNDPRSNKEQPDG